MNYIDLLPEIISILPKSEDYKTNPCTGIRYLVQLLFNNENGTKKLFVTLLETIINILQNIEYKMIAGELNGPIDVNDPRMKPIEKLIYDECFLKCMKDMNAELEAAVPPNLISSVIFKLLLNFFGDVKLANGTFVSSFDIQQESSAYSTIRTTIVQFLLKVHKNGFYFFPDNLPPSGNHQTNFNQTLATIKQIIELAEKQTGGIETDLINILKNDEFCTILKNDASTGLEKARAILGFQGFLKFSVLLKIVSPYVSITKLTASGAFGLAKSAANATVSAANAVSSLFTRGIRGGKKKGQNKTRKRKNKSKKRNHYVNIS